MAESVADLLMLGISFTDIMFYSIKSGYSIQTKGLEQFFKRHKDFDFIYTGSLEEDLYLPYYTTSGSLGNVSTDIDMLIMYKSIQIHPKPNLKTEKMLNHYWPFESEYPGYFHLLPLQYNMEDHKDSKLIQEHSLSCKVVIKEIEQAIKDAHSVSFMFHEASQRHGPSINFMSALSTGNRESADCVTCIPCSFWPACTTSFFERKRLHGFPSDSTLSDIKSDGCQFVPVGFHGSELYDYEWRLSSSLAEKKIVKEMSSKQKRAYRIAKSLIKSNSNTKEIVRSYYVKTILFWLCEEQSPADWEKAHDIENISQILTMLWKAYSKKKLPNYFVETNNMIRHIPDEELRSASEGIRSITDSLLQHLTQFLKSIKNLPVRLVFPVIECMKDVHIGKLSFECLFYFLTNFALCSLTYKLLSKVDTFHASGNKCTEYLTACENILTPIRQATKHKLSATDIDTADQTINKIFNIFEESLSYSESGETASTLITAFINIPCTILCGYYMDSNTTEECLKLIDIGVRMHHEWASKYVTDVFRKYPQYDIKQPGDLSGNQFMRVCWLEFFVILLIKYQNEGFQSFGCIGDVNTNTMTFPIVVRRLIGIWIYLDVDKTWVLLQIERALFRAKDLTSYLKSLPLLKDKPVATEIRKNINVKLLEIREKGSGDLFLKWQLARYYHALGMVNHDKDKDLFEEAMKLYEVLEAQKYTTHSIWKIDLFMLAITMNDVQKAIGWCQDVLSEPNIRGEKLRYDRCTLPIIPLVYEFEEGKDYTAVEIIAKVLIGICQLDTLNVTKLLKQCICYLEQVEVTHINGQIHQEAEKLCAKIEKEISENTEVLYERDST